jgi:hypothetical protein
MIHAGSLAIRTLRVTTAQGEVVVSQREVSQFFGSHQMHQEESFYGHFIRKGYVDVSLRTARGIWS